MENLVRIVKVSTIRPETPTQRHPIEVSAEDRHFAGCPYLRDVLFYKAPQEEITHGDEDAAWMALVVKLKRGLARVLVPFYPLAGRLELLHHPNCILIDCNDSGVQFVEAYTSASFADLARNHFPISGFLDDLVPFPRSLFGLHADDVPLALQVTRFSGGGITIGIAAGHVLMDGQSQWHFMTSWAECCRGEDVSVAPLHMRAALRKECWSLPNSIKQGNNGYGIDDQSAHESQPQTGLLNNPVCAFPPRPPQELQKVLHFSSMRVQQLKQAAIDHTCNPRISSLQVVLAHVWKCLIQAQASASASSRPGTTDVHDANQHVWLLLPLDIRTRLLPSLTPAYFGNAVKPVLVQSTLQKLLSEHSEASIALHIHESVGESTTHASVKQLLGENRLSVHVKEAISSKINFAVVGSGSKFPVFDVDLGFGKPLACRPVVVFDNLVLVYPSDDSGGIDVCVCMPDHQTLDASIHTCSCHLSLRIMAV